MRKIHTFDSGFITELVYFDYILEVVIGKKVLVYRGVPYRLYDDFVKSDDPQQFYYDNVLDKYTRVI